MEKPTSWGLLRDRIYSLFPGSCYPKMYTIQLLKAYINQRLTVAVEEIIEMFERTITEYEEETNRQCSLLRVEQLSGIKTMLNNE